MDTMSFFFFFFFCASLLDTFINCLIYLNSCDTFKFTLYQ